MTTDSESSGAVCVQ